MQVQEKPSLRARSRHSRSEPTPFSSQKSERWRSTPLAISFPSATASRPSGRSGGSRALRSTSSSVIASPVEDPASADLEHLAGRVAAAVGGEIEDRLGDL